MKIKHISYEKEKRKHIHFFYRLNQTYNIMLLELRLASIETFLKKDNVYSKISCSVEPKLHPYWINIFYHENSTSQS